jgi:LemA protein
MKNKGLLILGGLVVLLLILGSFSYNNFVKLGEDTNAKWAQVTTQYQRRFDLIPNLVSTVQGVAKQEKDVFVGIADARARVGQVTLSKEALSDPTALKNFNDAQGQLGVMVSRLLSVAEQYPALKSNENFMALQKEIEGTENRIAVARKDFNDVVQTYNTKVKTFPGVLFAKVFGFDVRPYFELQQNGAELAPAVKF